MPPLTSGRSTSEATVSRRLTSVRTRIREQLFQVFSKYSFTEEEWEELERNGLDLNPTKKDEATFDEAVAEVYHRYSRSGAASEARKANGALAIRDRGSSTSPSTICSTQRLAPEKSADVRLNPAL